MLARAKLFVVWVMAFSGLFLFSSATVGALTDWGQAEAYANTIKANKKEFGNSRHFVEVKKTSTPITSTTLKILKTIRIKRAGSSEA